MARYQLLRLMIKDRLSTAAEQICGLVEKTVKEYQDEVIRSKREIIRLRQQIQQQSVLKPCVLIFKPGPQSDPQRVVPPQQTQQPPTVVKNETPVPQQVKEEPADVCITPDLKADFSEDVKVPLCGTEDQKSSQPLPAFSSITMTLNDDDEWIGSECSGSSSSGPSDGSFSEREREQKGDKACRLCGERFDKNSDLCRHMDMVHAGQRAYKCSHCERQFSRRNHLAAHSRIHAGEKPHRCSFCGTSFAQKSPLSAHLRKHTREKPYVCKTCGKTVAYNYRFKTCGSTNSSGEKSFHCSVCGKKFHAASSLRVHMDVHKAGKSCADV